MKRITRLLLYVCSLIMLCLVMWFVFRSGKGLEPAMSSGSVVRLPAQKQLIHGAEEAFRHPLAIFILQLTLIIAASQICGWLFRKIGQPSVMGEIVAGILLGPSLMGVLLPQFSSFIFPVSSLGNLQMLSQVGLILFMFVIGMELDMAMLKQKAGAAVLISHFSIVIPFSMGIGLSWFLYTQYAPAGIPFYAFSLFTGIAMSITAFPVLARIIRERGLTGTKLGTIAITAAAAGDVAAWCILAFIVAIVKAGSISSSVYTIVAAVIYVSIMLLVVKPLLKRLAGIRNDGNVMKRSAMAVIFVVLLLSSYCCEVIGIHALFGAFLAGVIMPAEWNFRKLLMYKIKFLLTIMLAILPCYLFAGVLKGKVTNTNSTGLPYATIYIDGTTTGVTANGNGEFELEMAPGSYTVLCQYADYDQNTINISITGNETIAYNFILREQSLAMNENGIASLPENTGSAINSEEFHPGEYYAQKDSLIKELVNIDSTKKKRNGFRPLSFLFSGATFNREGSKNTFKINALLLSPANENMINYNIVEGFNLAPKLFWTHMADSGKYLHGDVAMRYGFSNTHFNAIGRLYYTSEQQTWRGRSWIYGAEGGRYVFQYDPDNPVLEWFNTYSDLFVRQNDLKIYERWDASLFLGRNYGNGLSWFIKPSYEQRLPLENTTDYSFIPGSKDGYSNNVPAGLLSQATAWEKHDAVLLYASISYQPGITYTQYPGYKIPNSSSWPTLTLTYDKGIPGILNSKVDFDKWRFSIRHEISSKLLGDLKYNIATGGFLNTTYVSIPDLMHLYGNRGIGFASPYLESFQFAQYYEFSNKAKLYGEAHAEYHLNGTAGNKVPLLGRAKYYLLFGGNAFYSDQNNFYTEAFIGIDNIGYKKIRILRIDFVQSWDSNKGTNSGIRFGINVPGLVTRSSPTHSEW